MVRMMEAGQVIMSWCKLGFVPCYPEGDLIFFLFMFSDDVPSSSGVVFFSTPGS